MESAENILKCGYNNSVRKENWLGDGVYFYPHFEDAYNWENIKTKEPSEAILHSVIRINEDELLDMDTQDGASLVDNLINELADTTDIGNIKNIEERECAAMRLIWKTYSKFNIIACSFAPKKKKINLLFDSRKKRREFCVRNNQYIINTVLIKRSDLDV